jgi:hypothetical protein
MLKLINGTKKPKNTFTDEQMTTRHMRMFQDGLNEFYGTGSRWGITKAVYNGVRLVNLHYRILSNHDGVPLDLWKGAFETYKNLEALMSLMTPEEIIRTFPITKTYDGKRWECADYFSTLSLFDGLNKNLSLMVQFKEPFDVLYGYQNPHICRLLTGMMCTVDKLRRAEGKDDLLTSFCKEQGIEPPETIRVCKDAKGKSYAIDNNGKSMPLHKAKPKWLKVVK